MMQYVWPFTVGCLVSALLAAVALRWGKLIPFAPRRAEGKKEVKRLGGLTMGLAFFMAIFSSPQLVIDRSLQIMLSGGLLILIFGFLDDLRERSWRWQFSFQLGVAILMFFGGLRITYIGQPFSQEIIHWQAGSGLIWSFLVGTVWLLALVNALNWLDGTDGVAGGVAFLAAFTIFFLSLKPEVNQPPMAIMAVALAGAVLGFLLFNFPPAKIFAGTSGAFFLGFMLAAMAIFAGTKIATTLIVMLLPILDFFRVIGVRLYKKQKPYLPDQRHFHHLLLEAGWSNTRVAVLVYCLTGLLALLALNTRSLGKMLIFFSALIIIGLIFFIDKKRKNSGH